MPLRQSGQAFLIMMSKIKKSAELILEQKHKQAIKFIKEALHINPNFANSMYIYSICLKKLDRVQQSQNLAKLAFNLNPCFFISLKNKEESILKTIIKQVKDNIPSVNSKMQECSSSQWVDMMNCCSKYKDLNTCIHIIQLFDKIKKPIQQYTTYVFSNFGINLYEVGEYNKSVEMYATAIMKYPNQFRYYNNSAILYYILGNYEKSEEFVYKSLAIKPNYAKSLFILSFSLAKTGRSQQAMQKIKQASQLTSDSLLYRLKIITNFLLYSSGMAGNPQQQIKSHIDIAYQIIKQNKDEDTYFFCPQNRPLLTSAISFIKQNLSNCDKYGQKWIEYLTLLDDYLIRGHADKFLITIKMNQIQKNFNDIKAKVDGGMEQKMEVSQG